MPETKPPAKVVEMKSRKARDDGWANVITGLGMVDKDKRLSGRFERNVLTEEEAEELWRGDDMAARVVETVPGEIVRAGWTVQIEIDDSEPTEEAPENEEPERDPADPPQAPRGDRRRRRDFAISALPEEEETEAEDNGKQQSEAVDAACDELNLYATIREAMEYARAYGGSGILLGTIDGSTDLTKPLDLSKVESLDFLTVLQPRELIPKRWYKDPRKKNFGRPEIYTIQQETASGAIARLLVDVHESRIVRFDGVVVSRRQLKANRGWGDSYLNRVNEVLRDFQVGWQGAAILMNDFAPPIFKIKGLAELLASDGGDSIILNRARILALCQSIARAGLIDSEEEFKRETVNVTGLPELLEKFSLRLAAAARMPVTLMMGQAPAGLNATGASDIRWFYDSIDAERARILRPRLNRILKVLFVSKRGPTGGAEPANWTVKFGPMWQLDAIQEADRRLKNAQADRQYVDAGVLMPEEVAASRFGGDTYGEDIVLDRAIREEADVQAEEEAEAEAERLKEMAQTNLQTSASVPGGKTTTPPKPSEK